MSQSESLASMSLKEAETELMASAIAGNALLLVSPSGIGKTSMIERAFHKMAKRDAARGITWGFGKIFAATQTPPDLIGYQFKGEKEYPASKDGGTVKVTITDPSVPLWMLSTEGKPAWMYDRFFLFIDEYGQGEPEVKRALAEIFLNGGTAPWYLPPGSVRVAASNEGSRYGVTKDFDFAIARRTRVNIHFDLKEWLEYADKPYSYQGRDWNVLPVTKAWAAVHPEIVCEKEPDVQGAWCNPRTLCAADRYIQARFELAGNTELTPTAETTIAGTIGTPAATSLCAFMKFRLELPSYDEVQDNPLETPVPKKPDLQMLMAYELAHMTEPEGLPNCIVYMERFPKDMRVTYLQAILRKDYSRMFRHPAMQAWINKNAQLLVTLQALGNV